MSHHHEHSHAVLPKNLNNAFIAGIVLNVVYVIVQMTVGIKIHSLSLISDASHNIADIASLVLALIGYKLTKVKANERFTYGYRKTSILIALVNSVLLLVSIGIIGIESVKRFSAPSPLPGKTIAIIAFIGIFINGISAFFLMRDKDKDLNVESAFMHLVADALISLAVVIGGIVIWVTGFYWIDAVLSLIISFFILVTTWKLLSRSMKLSLDAVPADIDLDDIRKLAMQSTGIINIHHIHIWAISTTENALTAHLLLEQKISIEEEYEIKQKLKLLLYDHNIHHVTLETERQAICDQPGCETPC